MFEKEAEERARKLEEKQTLGIYDNEEDYARDSGWNDGEVAGYEEGFKDGAEFGFQKGIKAKINTTTISDCPIKDEWHYVKDGDLPKDEKEVLVYMWGSFYIGYYSEKYDENNRWQFAELLDLKQVKMKQKPNLQPLLICRVQKIRKRKLIKNSPKQKEL